MPIKVNLHDNTSEIKVRVKGNNLLPLEAGDTIDYRKLEIKLDEEITNRIAGDEHLQEEINELWERSGAHYLDVVENSNGSISISILDIDEQVLDTKTITLTEKIIKSAVFDDENGKLVYICNDGSTIELDISTLVDDVEAAITDIIAIKQSLTILTGRVDSQELILSTITNNQGTGTLDIIHNTTIPAIQQDISIINQSISDINLTLSEVTDEVIPGITNRLDLLEPAVADAIVELSIINEKLPLKVDKDLSSYERYIPKDMTPVQIQEMLIYINNNGIPSYAKLAELGFARIRDIEDIDKVDSGDLLIDME